MRCALSPLTHLFLIELTENLTNCLSFFMFLWKIYWKVCLHNGQGTTGWLNQMTYTKISSRQNLWLQFSKQANFSSGISSRQIGQFSASYCLDLIFWLCTYLFILSFNSRFFIDLLISFLSITLYNFVSWIVASVSA